MRINRFIFRERFINEFDVLLRSLFLFKNIKCKQIHKISIHKLKQMFNGKHQVSQIR